MNGIFWTNDTDLLTYLLLCKGNDVKTISKCTHSSVHKLKIFQIKVEVKYLRFLQLPLIQLSLPKILKCSHVNGLSGRNTSGRKTENIHEQISILICLHIFLNLYLLFIYIASQPQSNFTVCFLKSFNSHGCP